MILKKYLNVTVTRMGGTKFKNHLKLSEAHLISKIAQDNLKVEIHCLSTTKEKYKRMFNS